jgi:tetratricopeptide (TPR) repeat protein
VLAAYLHLVSREPALAREAFLRVLALDPDHPRALLGLARLAIEDGDAEAAGGYLRRALQYHPDFPEARALEEMVAGWAPGAPPAEDGTAPAAEALAMPAGARDLILAHADGAVVLARCDEARQPRLAQHLSQLTRIASATLGRAGLGALRRAVVEGAAETSYLRADAALVLSVTLPSSAPSAAGLAEADRLWAQARRHQPARDA